MECRIVIQNNKKYQPQAFSGISHQWLNFSFEYRTEESAIEAVHDFRARYSIRYSKETPISFVKEE